MGTQYVPRPSKEVFQDVPRPYPSKASKDLFQDPSKAFQGGYDSFMVITGGTVLLILVIVLIVVLVSRRGI